MSNEAAHDTHQSLAERLLFPVGPVHEKRLSHTVSGKTILITGASFGIGAALAETLSFHNVTLLLVARTAGRLDAMASRFRSRKCGVHVFPTDLRDPAAIDGLLQKLDDKKISVDIFVSNAGKSIHRKLRHSLHRFHDTQRCSAVNYTGPVQLLLGLLPGIKSRQGQVINVSAVNVLLPPTAGWTAYQSSKAAFDQWLRCAEPELAASGIKTSTLYLPLVRTRMSMVNEHNHHRSAMSCEKAVRLVLRYMIHRRRRYRPWWTSTVLFANALLPGTWYRLQVKRLKQQGWGSRY